MIIPATPLFGPADLRDRIDRGRLVEHTRFDAAGLVASVG